MCRNAKLNHNFAKRKHTRTLVYIPDSNSINSTYISAVADISATLKATASMFVAPTLIPKSWSAAQGYLTTRPLTWRVLPASAPEHLPAERRDSSPPGQQQTQNRSLPRRSKAKIRALEPSMEPSHFSPPRQRPGFEDCPLPKRSGGQRRWNETKFFS